MAAGAPCEKCGGVSDVLDSRPRQLEATMAVARRRACRGCGFRWTTFEVSEAALAGASEAARTAMVARELREIADALEESG